MTNNMSSCHAAPIYTDVEDGNRYCSVCDRKQPAVAPDRSEVWDLSHGATKTVVVDADSLRNRLRRDLAEDLIPAGVTRVKAEHCFTDNNQVHMRLAGHTAVCVDSILVASE